MLAWPRLEGSTFRILSLMKATSFTLIAATLALVPLCQGALVFQEDFGSLADSTGISTSNTELTYVRIGSGGGVIDARSPSSFGSGASVVITQATSSTSLNGIGVQSTLPSSEIYTMTLDFRLLNLNGNVVFGIGSGTSFTGNSAFNTSQGLFWLQSDKGNFERRTSSWLDVAGGTTLSVGTNYQLHVVANGSAAPLSYGSNSVAAGKMDIYLNGNLIDDDVDVTTSLAADGFRIYQISQGDVEVDNISIYNSAQPIPEPAVALLGGLGVLGLLRRRR